MTSDRMATARCDERWLVVTIFVIQSILVTLAQSAATGDVISGNGEACSGMKSEAVDICTKCPDVTVARCCADINVFRRCLATANVTTSYLMTSEDKRARPFLGKRHARPFLGKRDDYGDVSNLEDLATEDKRARPFLGKRSDDSEEEFDKRARPFLGKRANAYDLDLQEEKRARPFLGKREQQFRNGAYKRPRPFLGKRGGTVSEEDGESEIDKRSRARPFLGKRSAEEHSSSKVRVKRARPFLGKRPRPFLGKRADTSEEWENEMIQHLLRLHPELLDGEDKRARPFLG